jgi:hypothetical protein
VRRLLDTSVLIDVLRGETRAHRRLAQLDEPPAISAMTVEELTYGLRPGEERALEHVLGGLDVVPVGLAEARLSATWRRESRARGITLGLPDCLIAACAVTAGAVLVTSDRRGFPMPEVTIEDWSRD